MDFTQLSYFKVVAEAENITKSAAELHVAQPALSKSISKLESELGIKLFDRDGNKIFLNQFGKTFLKSTVQILEQIKSSITQVQDLAGNTCGKITVGLSLPGIINKFLLCFLKKNPNIMMRELQGSPLQLKELLENHEIDIAITPDPIRQPNFQWRPLLSDELILAVSPKHSLASRDSVALSEFSNDRFLCNNLEFGHREITEHYCKTAGFTPNIVLESNDWNLLSQLISIDYGVAFIPATIRKWAVASNPGEGENIKTLRIDDLYCSRTFEIGTYEKHYLSKAAMLFYNSLENFFRNANSNLKCER
jgi:DNA-binding transcriptional LysR family regulator